MKYGIRIAALDDIPKGEGIAIDRAVTGTDDDIALLRDHDGCVWALNNPCTHVEASLSEGWVEDGYVECPLHSSKFCLKTGAVQGLPATRDAVVHRVEVSDGDVYLFPRQGSEMVASVVVVGGGIAGVSTIAALRAGGFEGELTLVDAGEFPYDRPPLSKDYLAGNTEIKDIALQTPQWYDDQQVRMMTENTVAALRPGLGAVELADGTTVSADRIVLATGGRACRPPIPGSDSSRVHVLRTADDADRLGATLVPGARLLIVGAGLIGAEVASTAGGLGCEVVLADPVWPPLSAAFSSDVAAWLHGMHEKRGVTTVNSAVKAFNDAAGGISATFAGDIE